MQIINEKYLHPQRVTSWCALWSAVVIVSHFFHSASYKAVTANYIRYREITIEILDLN